MRSKKEDLIQVLEVLLSRVRRAGRVSSFKFDIGQRFDWERYTRGFDRAPTRTGVSASLTFDLLSPFAEEPEPSARCRCGLTIGHEPTCPELDK